MKTNENNSSLPMNTMKDIPTPNPDARTIVGLTKKRGVISGYQLSDGQILDKPQAIDLARNGGISGVGIAIRNGNEYLKALPDGNEDNNLGSLPTIRL